MPDGGTSPITVVALLTSCVSFLVSCVCGLLVAFGKSKEAELRREIGAARDEASLHRGYTNAAVAKEEAERKATCGRLGERVGDLETHRGECNRERAVDRERADNVEERVRKVEVRTGSNPTQLAIRPRQPSRPGGE